jgi:ASC-1-like (ASCH) protein
MAAIASKDSGVIKNCFQDADPEIAAKVLLDVDISEDQAAEVLGIIENAGEVYRKMYVTNLKKPIDILKNKQASTILLHEKLDWQFIERIFESEMIAANEIVDFLNEMYTSGKCEKVTNILCMSLARWSGKLAKKITNVMNMIFGNEKQDGIKMITGILANAYETNGNLDEGADCFRGLCANAIKDKRSAYQRLTQFAMQAMEKFRTTNLNKIFFSGNNPAILALIWINCHIDSEKLVNILMLNGKSADEIAEFLSKVNSIKRINRRQESVANLFCEMCLKAKKARSNFDKEKINDIFASEKMDSECRLVILGRSDQVQCINILNGVYQNNKTLVFQVLNVTAQRNSSNAIRILEAINRSGNSKDIVPALLSNEMEVSSIWNMLYPERQWGAREINQEIMKYMKEIYVQDNGKVLQILNKLIQCGKIAEAVNFLLEMEGGDLKNVLNALLKAGVSNMAMARILTDNKLAIHEDAVNHLMSIYAENKLKAIEIMVCMCKHINSNAICMLTEMSIKNDEDCANVILGVFQSETLDVDTASKILTDQSTTLEAAEKFFKAMCALNDKSKMLTVFNLVAANSPEKTIKILLENESIIIDFFLNSKIDEISMGNLLGMLTGNDETFEKAVEIFEAMFNKDKKKACGVIMHMYIPCGCKVKNNENKIVASLIGRMMNKNNDIVESLITENNNSIRMAEILMEIDGHSEQMNEIFKDICCKSDGSCALEVVDKLCFLQSEIAIASLPEVLENNESRKNILQNRRISPEYIGIILTKMAENGKTLDRAMAIFEKIICDEDCEEEAMKIFNSMCDHGSKLAIAVLQKNLKNIDDFTVENLKNIDDFTVDAGMKNIMLSYSVNNKSIGIILVKMAEDATSHGDAMAIFELIYSKYSNEKAIGILDSMCSRGSKFGAEILLEKSGNADDIKKILRHGYMEVASIGALLTKMANRSEDFADAMKLFNMLYQKDEETAISVIGEMCMHYSNYDKIKAAALIILELLKTNRDTLVHIMSSESMKPEAVARIFTDNSTMPPKDAAMISFLMWNNSNKSKKVVHGAFGIAIDTLKKLKETALILESLISLNLENQPFLAAILQGAFAFYDLNEIFKTGQIKPENILKALNAMCCAISPSDNRNSYNYDDSDRVAGIMEFMNSEYIVKFLMQEKITPEKGGKFLGRILLKFLRHGRDDLKIVRIVRDMLNESDGQEKVARAFLGMSEELQKEILCRNSLCDYASNIREKMKEIKGATPTPADEDAISQSDNAKSIQPSTIESNVSDDASSTQSSTIESNEISNILKEEKRSQGENSDNTQSDIIEQIVSKNEDIYNLENSKSASCKIEKRKAPFIKWLGEIFTGTLNRALIVLAVAIIATIVVGAVIGWPVVLCIGIGGAIVEAGAIGLLHRHRSQHKEEDLMKTDGSNFTSDEKDQIQTDDTNSSPIIYV